MSARNARAKTGTAKAKPGTISLRVACSRAGNVKVTGTLIESIGRKPAHGKKRSITYKLGPVSASAGAGKVLTLTVQLPAAAVSALGHGAKESVTLTVTPVGRGGRGAATTTITALRAAR